ncbi:MAG: hypothetical protein AB8E87_03355 [Prochlorococcus sp.]
MPRYRCLHCCCGSAIVLKPPAGAVPLCPRCASPLERQPLVRPIPLLVLLAVGSSLLVITLPGLIPPAAPPITPATPRANPMA